MANIFPRKPIKRPKTSAQKPQANLIVGLTPVLAALRARGAEALSLWIANTRSPGPILAEIVDLAQELGLPIQKVDRQELDRLSLTLHQGVIAQFKPRPVLAWGDFLASLDLKNAPQKNCLLLALDHLEDPHNLGALWRSSAAFGVKGLICPKDRAALPTQVVYKTAAGGAEVTPLFEVTNLVRALEDLKEKGFWLVGAEGEEGQSLWDFAFPERTVLILGSEGQGLSRLVREKTDFLVHIPLTGPINSLNVSAAGAVLLAAYAKTFQP